MRALYKRMYAALVSSASQISFILGKRNLLARSLLTGLFINSEFVNSVVY